MKHVYLGLLLLSFLCTVDSAQAQPWIHEYLTNGRVGNVDSLVSNFLAEMKNKVGNQPPDLNFQPVNQNDSVSITKYFDQPTIIMFWKTNCSGCTMQLAELSDLHREYADIGFNVLYLSPQNKSTLQDFIESRDLSGIFGTINRQKLMKPYQVFATPSAYLVDRNGYLQDVWIRPERFQSLEKRITPFL